MPSSEEKYRKMLERKLERIGLAPKEVKRALREADEFAEGLDEVFDDMFPEPDPKQSNWVTDYDQFGTGAIE